MLFKVNVHEFLNNWIPVVGEPCQTASSHRWIIGCRLQWGRHQTAHHGGQRTVLHWWTCSWSREKKQVRIHLSACFSTNLYGNLGKGSWVITNIEMQMFFYDSATRLASYFKFLFSWIELYICTVVDWSCYCLGWRWGYMKEYKNQRHIMPSQKYTLTATTTQRDSSSKNLHTLNCLPLTC